MDAPHVKAYGTWTSSITSSMVSGSAMQLAELMVDPQTDGIYIVENRPAENGRGVVVRINDGESVDILPKKYHAKSKIHARQVAAATICSDRRIVFTDFNTNGVYFLSPTGEVEEIIAGSQDPEIYYADFNISPTNPNHILAIKAIHHKNGDIVDTIDLIDSRTRTSRVVLEGADFYSNARFSPDGKHVCWTQWNHPDMPWTGSQLYVADCVDGQVVNQTHVAGKSLKASACQPRWSPDGKLWFADEPEGFWQFYRYDITSKKVEYIHIRGYEKVEMARCEWGPATSTYGFLDKDSLVIVYTESGATGIITYNVATDTVTELPLGLVDVEWNGLRVISPSSFVVTGATTMTPLAVYKVDLANPTQKNQLRSSINIDLPLTIFSPAQRIEYPRTHGHGRSRPAHAVFVPPHNPAFQAPKDALPPLIINIHGGPTGHMSPALSMQVQYFTSRGYAYTHINYAGSSGHGRAYRDDLNQSWGIKDVEDTLSCIDYLATNHLIDRSRIAIRGASAGGYTTFQALCNHPNVFAAGCSLFGVGNLKDLAETTHKFESHYLFNLLFFLNATEAQREEVYHARSPCFHVDKIQTPLLMFQGTKDVVVPLQQAIEMEKALTDAGKDVTVVIFEGEGHGFRKEENVKRQIEDEEAFYARTLLA